MTGRVILAAVGLGILCRAAGAADWPQWRGPQRTGVSQETGLLKSWPQGGPKLLWRVSGAGGGYSTPAVVGNWLFTLGNEGNDNEFVQARAVGDGKVAWTTRIGRVGNPDQQPSYPGCRSTVTVEGDVLYAMGSDGDVACLETASGRVRWHKNVRTEFGGQPGVWAYSESPLVEGNRLIVTPGGAAATLLALDKRNGNVLWRCPVPGGDQAGYSSVMPITVGGIRQYVQFLQKGVVGVEAESGRFLWRYDRTAQNSPANIPTPVVSDDQVYTASGRGGAALLKLTQAGGTVHAQEVYYNQGLPSSIGGSLRIGPHLYGTSGRGLMCMEFGTGMVRWVDRSVGPGAVCYADGNLYVRGETGEVALVEATPEGYREKGRFTPPDAPQKVGGLRAWAYPVVANGRLYLRDLDAIWCYEIKG